jgi:hypothetical protein
MYARIHESVILRTLIGECVCIYVCIRVMADVCLCVFMLRLQGRQQPRTGSNGC